MSRASERIHADPLVCGGKPVIRGTRIMVRNILSQIQAGKTNEQILASYPGIDEDDIKAALEYAMELVDEVRLPLRSVPS